MGKLHPLMVAQLLAVRAACEATIWGVNALLEASEGANPPVEASQPSSERPSSNGNQSHDPSLSPEMAEPGTPTETGECPHPAEHRRNAPAMGKSNRQVCGLCRQEVK